MNETMISLDDMRLFAVVAEDLSFTRAADRLGMPKQTLSRRIAALEKALGLQLLHRSTRRVRLTEVGAGYARKCAELVLLAEEAHREVSLNRAEVVGCLRLTCDQFLGETLLPPILTEFAHRYPKVRMELSITPRKVDLVAEGFDIALRVGETQDPELIATRLGPAEIRFCAAPSYVARFGRPDRPRDLVDHTCIAVVEGSARPKWPFLMGGAPAWVPIEPRLRVNNYRIARQSVLSGLGISVLPAIDCGQEIEAGELISILEAYLYQPGSIYLVKPGRRYLPARVRAFSDLVVERFQIQPG
ncbi:LysR family transcriptional regulator [Sulfidibacter corallicola]|uniref:LysR family transcriptional regulator n=1 Tax=Sulfidibacter corallicola TaxID=2818388 RepID=A0A8A4TQQ8_SULCO|nr:LysR family transcriptional regulator [Sulfidibacter corallicola]QTD51338.1 LysR family transcriptional regulator [Sulfidibacter corallicola]